MFLEIMVGELNVVYAMTFGVLVSYRKSSRLLRKIADSLAFFGLILDEEVVVLVFVTDEGDF